MNSNVKFLTEFEFNLLTIKIDEIRLLIIEDISKLNDYYSFLKNVNSQFVIVEQEYITIQSKLISILDNIDSTATINYLHDVNFDFLNDKI